MFRIFLEGSLLSRSPDLCWKVELSVDTSDHLLALLRMSRISKKSCMSVIRPYGRTSFEVLPLGQSKDRRKTTIVLASNQQKVASASSSKVFKGFWSVVSSPILHVSKPWMLAVSFEGSWSILLVFPTRMDSSSIHHHLDKLVGASPGHTRVQITLIVQKAMEEKNS